MLNALLVFLVGCLVLAVVVYVVKLLMDMFGLPDPIYKIALLIVGLIGFVIVIMLAVRVFNGAPIWL